MLAGRVKLVSRGVSGKRRSGSPADGVTKSAAGCVVSPVRRGTPLTLLSAGDGRRRQGCFGCQSAAAEAVRHLYGNNVDGKRWCEEEKGG